MHSLCRLSSHLRTSAAGIGPREPGPVSSLAAPAPSRIWPPNGTAAGSQRSGKGAAGSLPPGSHGIIDKSARSLPLNPDVHPAAHHGLDQLVVVELYGGRSIGDGRTPAGMPDLQLGFGFRKREPRVTAPPCCPLLILVACDGHADVVGVGGELGGHVERLPAAWIAADGSVHDAVSALAEPAPAACAGSAPAGRGPQPGTARRSRRRRARSPSPGLCRRARRSGRETPRPSRPGRPGGSPRPQPDARARPVPSTRRSAMPGSSRIRRGRKGTHPSARPRHRAGRKDRARPAHDHLSSRLPRSSASATQAPSGVTDTISPRSRRSPQQPAPRRPYKVPPAS